MSSKTLFFSNREGLWFILKVCLKPAYSPCPVSGQSPVVSLPDSFWWDCSLIVSADIRAVSLWGCLKNIGGPWPHEPVAVWGITCFTIHSWTTVESIPNFSWSYSLFSPSSGMIVVFGGSGLRLQLQGMLKQKGCQFKACLCCKESWRSVWTDLWGPELK